MEIFLSNSLSRRQPRMECPRIPKREEKMAKEIRLTGTVCFALQAVDRCIGTISEERRPDFRGSLWSQLDVVLNASDDLTLSEIGVKGVLILGPATRVGVDAVCLVEHGVTHSNLVKVTIFFSDETNVPVEKFDCEIEAGLGMKVTKTWGTRPC